MNRFIRFSFLALVAALGFGTSGCRKGSKHPTPIPGYYANSSTNYSGGDGFGGSGIMRNSGSGRAGGASSGGRISDATDTTGGRSLAPAGGDSSFGDANKNGGGSGSGPNLNPNGIPTGDINDMDTWPQDRVMFQGNKALFEYDRASVKKSELAKVAAVGEHMKSNPTHGLLIEGHCDERGTDGYNLALGERRALALREVLVNLGVSASRIRTISFGENKPAVDGHDESAWSQNRRGEFILLTPPAGVQ